MRDLSDQGGDAPCWAHLFEDDGATPTDDALAALVRTPLDLIVPERLRERHNHGFRHAMAAGETKYGEQLLEVPAAHRDGRPLSIAFTVTLLPCETGVGGVAAVIRDETRRFQERKQVRAELEALRQAATS